MSRSDSARKGYCLIEESERANFLAGGCFRVWLKRSPLEWARATLAFDWGVTLLICDLDTGEIVA